MRRKNVWKTPVMGIAISLALVTQLTAQQQPGKVEFDVVSIKPADPAASGHMTQQPPGALRARNLRLFELIMGAWGLNHDQIFGGPNWLETAGWDIDARFPAGTSQAQVSQMMQAMLADRFQLATHRETRTLPVYASAGDAAQDTAPSIFQALQDQAGLKLESTRGPVEVLVIDHAEKPTPN